MIWNNNPTFCEFLDLVQPRQLLQDVLIAQVDLGLGRRHHDRRPADVVGRRVEVRVHHVVVGQEVGKGERHRANAHDQAACNEIHNL